MFDCAATPVTGKLNSLCTVGRADELSKESVMGRGNLDPTLGRSCLPEKIQVAGQPRASHVTSLGSRGHVCKGGTP